jgi:hypothetical protein
MSQNLVAFIHDFLNHPYDCSTFCDQYIRRWKDEGDRGELRLDDGITSEALSTIFCLADLFNPDGDREEYELDEQRLRLEILRVLGALPGSGIDL